mgnify:CR=1 FL=1
MQIKLIVNLHISLFASNDYFFQIKIDIILVSLNVISLFHIAFHANINLSIVQIICRRN